MKDVWIDELMIVYSTLTFLCFLRQSLPIPVWRNARGWSLSKLYGMSSWTASFLLIKEFLESKRSGRPNIDGALEGIKNVPLRLRQIMWFCFYFFEVKKWLWHQRDYNNVHLFSGRHFIHLKLLQSHQNATQGHVRSYNVMQGHVKLNNGRIYTEDE